MPPTRLLAVSAAACLAATPLFSFAQVTVKDDGQWRALFTAGASVSSGNSDSTTINLSGDVVKATKIDKLTFNGRALYVKNDDVDAEQRYAFGTGDQRDVTERVFGFGQFDALKDEPANLSSRYSVGAGAGYHLIKQDNLTWDVSTGVGFTQERYVVPALQDGVLRSKYSNTELLFAEESNHKISDNTTFKQRLAYLPDLRNSGEFRATFDGGISVAMTQRFSLTATVQHRYDSNPGDGLKKNDTLFVTGVSYRID